MKTNKRNVTKLKGSVGSTGLTSHSSVPIFSKILSSYNYLRRSVSFKNLTFSGTRRSRPSPTETPTDNIQIWSFFIFTKDRDHPKSSWSTRKVETHIQRERTKISGRDRTGSRKPLSDRRSKTGPICVWEESNETLGEGWKIFKKTKRNRT